MSRLQLIKVSFILMFVILSIFVRAQDAVKNNGESKSLPKSNLKEVIPKQDENEPLLLVAPIPVYPEYAKENGIEGDVWVKINIDKEGRVRAAIIEKESESDVGFEEATIKAALGRIYRPAIKDGEPIGVWYEYKISFRNDVDRPYGEEEINIDRPKAGDFSIIDVEPILLSGKEPEYPAEAKKEGIEGFVWVNAYVNEDGIVRRAEIARDSGIDVGFEEAALEAAIERKYKPAMLEGEPIGVWIAYKVVFELDD